MKKNVEFLVLLIALFTLAACSQSTPELTPVSTKVTDAPPLATAVPTEDVSPVVTLSYQSAIFRDESSGVELDYPSDWTVAPFQQVGERGAQASILSPGSTAEEIADGGSRLFLTTYAWDPKNDLDAYIAQRKIAWDASGFVILSEEGWQLSDGRRVVDFFIETPEKNQLLFSLTTAGDDYLQISSDGNLTLCREIVLTLRAVSE